MNRQDIVNRVVSALIGLTISGMFTYVMFPFLADVLDPTRKEKREAEKRARELMKKIGVADVKLGEYELCIASNLMDPLSITTTWSDIGGMKAIIDELRETVILPFKRRDLFEGSTLLSPPKGVLLYGPPGCGKTMIAKAIAKEAGARFINLQVSSLFDKWYGESQKRAEAVFSLAIKLQPVIIFIDEIDSFLRARDSHDHESTVMMKTQFMSFWDGIETDNKCQVMIIGATNRPNDVDWAILRRMPSMFNVKLPDEEERIHIMKIILRNEELAPSVDLKTIALKTNGFSGSDLKELCRKAAVRRVRDILKNEGDDSPSSTSPLRPLTIVDFLSALNNVNQSELVQMVSAQQKASPIPLD